METVSQWDRMVELFNEAMELCDRVREHRDAAVRACLAAHEHILSIPGRPVGPDWDQRRQAVLDQLANAIGGGK